MTDYLYISEPEPRDSGPILVCDAEHNDVAEFFHEEHATVPISYETALELARILVRDRAADIDSNAILESAALIADQIDDCQSSTYDNGGTEDGYRQAKYHIADAIRALKVSPLSSQDRGTQ